jgi:hypothetical protein
LTNRRIAIRAANRAAPLPRIDQTPRFFWLHFHFRAVDIMAFVMENVNVYVNVDVNGQKDRSLEMPLTPRLKGA